MRYENIRAELPTDRIDHEALSRTPPRYVTHSFTVTSKVKLRSLIEETRVKGWSIANQELENGLRSIAVPVMGRSGKVVCALNVACPSSRITPDDMHNKILLELQAASQTITAGLHH